MAQDSLQVAMAVEGNVYSDDLGSPAPTSAISAVNATAIEHGYTTEDGFSATENSTSNNVAAWQRRDTVRTYNTDSFIEFKVTLIQDNADNAELAFGVKPIASGAGVGATPWKAGRERPTKVFWFDTYDPDLDQAKRFYIARGKVMTVGTMTFNANTTISYELTIRAFPVPGQEAEVLIFDEYGLAGGGEDEEGGA